jgi:hypothetical protein
MLLPESVLPGSARAAYDFVTRSSPHVQPDGVLPGWSLSAWLWLWDGPSGSPRNVFYKGSGDNRTPSAWLLPDVMKMALRVTSPRDINLGADSTVDLPVRTWTHVVFTFQNSSISPRTWDSELVAPTSA